MIEQLDSRHLRNKIDLNFTVPVSSIPITNNGYSIFFFFWSFTVKNNKKINILRLNHTNPRDKILQVDMRRWQMVNFINIRNEGCKSYLTFNLNFVFIIYRSTIMAGSFKWKRYRLGAFIKWYKKGILENEKWEEKTDIPSSLYNT